MVLTSELFPPMCLVIDLEGGGGLSLIDWFVSESKLVCMCAPCQHIGSLLCCFTSRNSDMPESSNLGIIKNVPSE